MDTVLSWITGNLTPAARVWLALAPALVASAYFLVGLLVYMVRYVVRGPYRDPEMEARGESILASMWFRLYFIWLMQPLWRLVLRSGVPPTSVTTLSLLVAVGAGVALAAGRFSLGGWLYIASGILDIMDGRLARARNQVTQSGGALDSILDRYADAAVLCGLAWFYRDSWVLVPVLVAIIGTSLVPYVRAKGESLGISIKTGVMQRAERIMYLGIGCAISPTIEVIFEPDNPRSIHRMAVAGIILLAVATQLTALHRIIKLLAALGDSALFVPRQAREVGAKRRFAAMCLAVIVDFSFFATLVTQAGIGAPTATASGCVVGGVVGWLSMRLIAYGGTQPKLPQAGRYAFISLTSAALSAGGVGLMLFLPTMNFLLAWLLVRFAVFVAWNFPLQRDYVFARPDDPNDA